MEIRCESPTFRDRNLGSSPKIHQEKSASNHIYDSPQRHSFRRLCARLMDITEKGERFSPVVEGLSDVHARAAPALLSKHSTSPNPPNTGQGLTRHTRQSARPHGAIDSPDPDLQRRHTYHPACRSTPARKVMRSLERRRRPSTRTSGLPRAPLSTAGPVNASTDPAKQIPYHCPG